MAEAENREEPGKQKPWPRNAKFILYAIILLVALLWIRHEKAKREEALTAEAEANMQRQRELDAKKHRIQAAFLLIKKAESAKDPAEEIHIYDEIIDTYQGDESKILMRYVAWALYKKALAVMDATERMRLFEEVVDRYCDMPDKEINNYVMGTLREMLQRVDRGSAKFALCERLLGKYGSRLSDSAAAWLLSQEADAVQGRNEKIVIYDAMLSRFLSSGDAFAFDLAVIAAMDKLKLVGEKNEQLRLCDIAVNAFLKTPQRTRHYLFDRAVKKKAELVGDPSLPLEFYDQVIAKNVTETAVVQARSLRLPFLKNDEERLTACDEFVTAHQNSKSDFVQLMVARAMENKAELLIDPEAKAALFRAVVEKCATVEDSRARDLANSTVAKLASLSGDTSASARHYDEQIAKAKNLREALEALKSKAKVVEDPAEKIRLYDEIIARCGDSSDELESREAVDAIFKKADLTGDKAEKIKLYDAIIARGRDSHDAQERTRVADAMFYMVRLLDSTEYKIRLYDEIIARGQESGNIEELAKAAEAMLGKAKITDDKDEKIRLYDTVLFDLGLAHNRYFLSEALRDRIRLTAGEADKLHLYDRYIDSGDGSMNPNTRLSLLLDKAEVVNDPAARIPLYDEVIKLCEQSLNGKGSDGEVLLTEDHIRRSFMKYLSRAVLGKANLTGSTEAKLELYDKYLAYPQEGRLGFMDDSLESILTPKAELSGDPSVRSDYYAERIRSATTDQERVAWYVRKAEGARMPERAQIEEKMISRFFDSAEEEVEGEVAKAYFGMAMRTVDVNERNRIFDRLIARYGDSTDSEAQHEVVRAFNFRAKMEKDDTAKMKLYTTVIEKYLNVDDYRVKEAVDDIIANRFRLEAKMKKNAATK